MHTHTLLHLHTHTPAHTHTHTPSLTHSHTHNAAATPTLELTAPSTPVVIGATAEAVMVVPITGWTSNVTIELHAPVGTTYFDIQQQDISAVAMNGTIEQTFDSASRNITGSFLMDGATPAQAAANASGAFGHVPFQTTRINTTAVRLSFGLLSTTKHTTAPPAIALLARLHILGSPLPGYEAEVPLASSVLFGNVHPVPILASDTLPTQHPQVLLSTSPEVVPTLQDALDAATITLSFTPDTALATLHAVLIDTNTDESNEGALNASFALTTAACLQNPLQTSCSAMEVSSANLTASSPASHPLVLTVTTRARSGSSISMPRIAISFQRWHSAAQGVYANPTYTQTLSLSPTSVRLPAVQSSTVLSTAACLPEGGSGESDGQQGAHISAAPGATVFACMHFSGPALRFSFQHTLSLPALAVTNIAVSTNLNHPSNDGTLTADIAQPDLDAVAVQAEDVLLFHQPLVVQVAFRVRADEDSSDTALSEGSSIFIGILRSSNADATSQPEVAFRALAGSGLRISILEPALELSYTTPVPTPATLEAGDVLQYTLALTHRPWSSAAAFGACMSVTMTDHLCHLQATALPQEYNCTAVPLMPGAGACVSAVQVCCASPLPLGSTLHAVLSATVDPVAPPLAQLRLSANGTFASADATVATSFADELTSSLGPHATTLASASQGNITDDAAVVPARMYAADVETNTTETLLLSLVPQPNGADAAAQLLLVRDSDEPQRLCVNVPLAAAFDRHLPFASVDHASFFVDLQFENTRPANWSIEPSSLEHTATQFSLSLAGNAAPTVVSTGSTYARAALAFGAPVAAAVEALLASVNSTTVETASFCFDIQRHTVLAHGGDVRDLAGTQMQTLANASAADPTARVEYRTASVFADWPSSQLLLPSQRASPWYHISATDVPTVVLQLVHTDVADTLDRDVALHELLVFEVRACVVCSSLPALSQTHTNTHKHTQANTNTCTF